MMVYKVSYILGDEETPGIIRSRDTYPRIGEIVPVNGQSFVIREIEEMSTVQTDSLYMLIRLEPEPSE